MIERRALLSATVSIAFSTTMPAWAQSSNRWTPSVQRDYSLFMLKFLVSSTSEGSREVDCADLAIIGLIKFADSRKLPVKLFDYDGPRGARRWFKFTPGVSGQSDALDFENSVLPELGAVNLLDRGNTNAILPKDIRCGDLLANEVRGASGYTGHVRVALKSEFDPQANDWKIDWIQGSGSYGSGSLPQERSGFFREIQPAGALKCRRWNFAQFN